MAGERLARALPEFRARYGADKGKRERSGVLDEFCGLTRYHRKYAIAWLNEGGRKGIEPVRRRGPAYSRATVRAAEYI
jgi:hypothetical protein